MRPPRLRRLAIGPAVALLCSLVGLGVGQVRSRIWAQYEPEMQDPVDDPPGAGRKGEFGLGRLRYRSPMDTRRFYSRWGIGANKGDRLFIAILQRKEQAGGTQNRYQSRQPAPDASLRQDQTHRR